MTARTTLFILSAGVSLLLTAAPIVHAQENGGDPGGDPANPLFDGVAPGQCATIAWDAPRDPNARWIYECGYPSGVIASWRSDTDSTLLGWNTGCDLKHCTGTDQETAAGHAYLDGPESSQPVACQPVSSNDICNDPGPDPANPLFQGAAPERCEFVQFDTARSVYSCDYPNGAGALFQSDTDSTLLGWNTGTGPQRTTAGHAYLDGPAPGQSPGAIAPTQAVGAPTAAAISPTAAPVPTVQPTATPTPGPQPLLNGQMPTQCGPSPVPPGLGYQNQRDPTYTCIYPDGTLALYQSATNLTLLLTSMQKDPQGTLKPTPAGCAEFFSTIKVLPNGNKC
jgi:hypothetical protein